MQYVSLGHICAIARDLEKLGLRSSSMPFDWCVTELKGNIEAIKNGFEDYLTYELLEQSYKCQKHYKNPKYNVQFFHDFNYFETLEEQLPMVKDKYNRRIKRFYKTIQKPTIFIRYISDVKKIDGKAEELIWIEENYAYILETLKSFNSQNDIIFIANEGVTSSKINIFNVKKDNGDVITRFPITRNSNKELTKLFNNKVSSSNKKMIRLKRKKIRFFKLLNNLTSFSFIYKFIKFGMYRLLSKKYVHSKQY